MQNELAGSDVAILGLNQIGSESGNDVNCDGRDIPWLQDNTTDRTWDLWEVTYRDVYILNRANELVAVYNLTTNNLGDAAKYAELKALIEDALASP